MFLFNDTSYTTKNDENDQSDTELNTRLPSISVKDISNNDIAYFLSSNF